MSYQGDLQDDLIHARHEAGHALHAHLVGHIVLRVNMGRPEAFCDIEQPVSPETLALKWPQSPLIVSLELCRIIGTLRAGALCELAGRDVSGRDAAALTAWQQAYVSSIGSNADWTKLYAHVFERLTAWHRHQSVRSAVSCLAEMLLRQRETARQAWLSMVEIAAIDMLCPEPAYSPLLPSPTRSQSSPVSNRSHTSSVALRAASVPLMEDAKHLYYDLDTLAGVTLFSRVNKSTGLTTFMVVKGYGCDIEGKPQVQGSEHSTESDARRAMAAMAG